MSNHFKNGDVFEVTHNGTTLPGPTGLDMRDYFAAQIIVGLSINRQGKTNEDDATNAYLLADAMLAERNKP
jgi:hypothetical protein